MKKLHQAPFFLLVLLLPVQLGRHFWPDSSLVFGIRIDYLSPTIYFTDLLVIGILATWLFKIRKKKDKICQQLKRHWWLGAVSAFFLLNTFLAQNQAAAFYQLVKMLELALLGFYLAKNDFIRYPLGIAVIYSSFLALAQFLKQASLNGIFWWLGERTFNAFTPGIARAVWDGQLIMRPYATFPHPNTLAGFILVSLILIAIGKTRDAKRKIVRWLAVVLGIVGIFLSFSRAVWLASVLILLPISYFFFPKKKRLWAISLSIILSFCFLWLGTHLGMEEAISRRLQLNQAALEMVQGNSLVGVGLNNFVPRLPDYWQTSEAVRFLQPVHNIFLLVAAETGLIGLLIFLWFLILTFKKLLITKPLAGGLIIALSAILLLGFFDHYWLTLQQTQLLFTLILGMSWAKH